MKVACGNCNWKGAEERCAYASDIEQRHGVGSIYSDLECPKCQSLCYPENPLSSYPWSLFVACKSEEEYRGVKHYRDERRAAEKVLKKRRAKC